MALTLYFHPLSGFCQKVLIALYENETPFTPQLVDFGDPQQRADFLKLWPIGLFPLLRDDSNSRLVPETSLIIEYLALHYPGPVALLPENPIDALEIRRLDRILDLHVAIPMQKIVLDRRRPEGGRTRSASPRPRGGWLPPTPCWKPSSTTGAGWPATISPWPTAPRRRHCSMASAPCRSRPAIRVSLPISSGCGRGRPSRGCWPRPSPISSSSRAERAMPGSAASPAAARRRTSGPEHGIPHRRSHYRKGDGS